MKLQGHCAAQLREHGSGSQATRADLGVCQTGGPTNLRDETRVVLDVSD
jgi:hypothetical protein